MKDFIDKMLELGANYQMACSETERNAIRKSAEVLYKNHVDINRRVPLQLKGELTDPRRDQFSGLQ